MTSFHYFDLPTLLTRLRYVVNGYFHPEFIDEAQKQRKHKAVLPKARLGPSAADIWLG